MDVRNTYLLDTNILSDMMRNPSGVAAQRFLKLAQSTPNVKLCTSVIVQCELLFGLSRRTHPRWQTHYDKVLESVELLPLDSTVVPSYANLRSLLESAGTPIGPNDTLIAAQALSIDATLVSADAEFLRVPGLRVENWLSGEEKTQIPA
ncbi:MAG: type II toxin-antitoxin system VapC family toxin [Polaromonas sp.]|nr:type II toxin-antitoxin system VapC family toxin [Polaromonas sp.]